MWAEAVHDALRDWADGSTVQRIQKTPSVSTGRGAHHGFMAKSLACGGGQSGFTVDS